MPHHQLPGQTKYSRDVVNVILNDLVERLFIEFILNVQSVAWHNEFREGSRILLLNQFVLKIH